MLLSLNTGDTICLKRNPFFKGYVFNIIGTLTFDMIKANNHTYVFFLNSDYFNNSRIVLIEKKFKETEM